jgi:hypothetical protein
VELIPLASWKSWFSQKEGKTKKEAFLGAHALLVPIISDVADKTGFRLTRKIMNYSLGQFIENVCGAKVALTGEVLNSSFSWSNFDLHRLVAGFEESSDPASTGTRSFETPSSSVCWF